MVMEFLASFSWTERAFFALVGMLAIQRLFELRISRRNEAWMQARGGREHFPRHFLAMKLLHSTWFIAMIAEVALLNRPTTLALAAGAGILVIAGQLLRYAAIRTLGPRWSVKIFTVPGAPPVQGGIYRYVRHPNYAGVILEIFATPLLHGAWLTALIYTILNAALLYVRIGCEERALAAENEYAKRMGDRPRFIPGLKAE